jgi:hypothetical protein
MKNNSTKSMDMAKNIAIIILAFLTITFALLCFVSKPAEAANIETNEKPIVKIIYVRKCL